MINIEQIIESTRKNQSIELPGFPQITAVRYLREGSSFHAIEGKYDNSHSQDDPDLDPLATDDSYDLNQNNSNGKKVVVKIPKEQEKAKEIIKRYYEVRDALGETDFFPKILPGGNGCIIEEYCGESLEHLVREGKLSEKECLNIIYQSIKIIDYMHSKGVVHGDLHPGNILYDRSTKKVRITDFNLSCTDQSPDQEQQQDRQQITVSLLSQSSNSNVIVNPFLPPERVYLGSNPKKEDDWYALGGILWFLLTGETPLKKIECDPSKKNPSLQINYKKFFEEAFKEKLSDGTKFKEKLDEVIRESKSYGEGVIIFGNSEFVKALDPKRGFREICELDIKGQKDYEQYRIIDATMSPAGNLAVLLEEKDMRTKARTLEEAIRRLEKELESLQQDEKRIIEFYQRVSQYLGKLRYYDNGLYSAFCELLEIWKDLKTKKEDNKPSKTKSRRGLKELEELEDLLWSLEKETRRFRRLRDLDWRFYLHELKYMIELKYMRETQRYSEYFYHLFEGCFQKLREIMRFQRKFPTGESDKDSFYLKLLRKLIKMSTDLFHPKEVERFVTNLLVDLLGNIEAKVKRSLTMFEDDLDEYDEDDYDEDYYDKYYYGRYPRETDYNKIREIEESVSETFRNLREKFKQGFRQPNIPSSIELTVSQYFRGVSYQKLLISLLIVTGDYKHLETIQSQKGKITPELASKRQELDSVLSTLYRVVIINPDGKKSECTINPKGLVDHITWNEEGCFLNERRYDLSKDCYLPDFNPDYIYEIKRPKENSTGDLRLRLDGNRLLVIGEKAGIMEEISNGRNIEFFYWQHNSKAAKRKRTTHAPKEEGPGLLERASRLIEKARSFLGRLFSRRNPKKNR